MTKQPRINSVQKTADGVLIRFDDGKVALYSAVTLHDNFSPSKPELVNQESAIPNHRLIEWPTRM
jgi:hypothetical protein